MLKLVAEPAVRVPSVRRGVAPGSYWPTEAVASGARWARRLGTPPTDATELEGWRAAIATVAAYRDRYKVTGDLSLGGGASNDAKSQTVIGQRAPLSEAIELSRGSKAAHRRAASGRALFGP